MKMCCFGVLLVLLTGCKYDQHIEQGCGCDVFMALFSSFKSGRLSDSLLGSGAVNCKINIGGDVYSVAYRLCRDDNSVVSLWSRNGIVDWIQLESICKVGGIPMRFIDEDSDGGLIYAAPECSVESCDPNIKSTGIESVLCRLKVMKNTSQAKEMFGTPNCIIGRECSAIGCPCERHPVQYCYFFKQKAIAPDIYSMTLTVYNPFGWLLKISRN